MMIRQQRSARKVGVSVDIFPLLNTPNSGVGQYVRGIIMALAEQKKYELKFLVFKSDDVTSLSLCQYGEIVVLPYHRRLYSTLWKCGIKINVAEHLGLSKESWVLYTNFGMLPYIDDKRMRSITIIHDLTYQHFPETVTKRNLFFLKQAVPFSLKNSDYIVTPSRFTANDLLRFPVIKNRDIQVAYPGYDSTSFKEQRPLLAPDKPYLLYLATIEPRKNILNLVEAFSKLNLPDFVMVIAGKKGWGNIELRESHNLCILGEVTNEEREWLLEHCSAVMFPSLFEGFGMPVVEAMRHAKPVLTSDTSSLKEIANEHNAYVVTSPYGQQEIFTVLGRMVNDIRQGKSESRAQNGYQSSQAFTWEACAKTFTNIIESQK